MKLIKNSTYFGYAKAAALAAAASIGSAHAATTVNAIGTLSIDPAASADLGAEALIVSVTPFATVAGYVVAGSAGGAWTGFGINSSVAAAAAFPTAIGVVNNADFGVATFFGIAVSGTSTLARFTYYGDANLDGIVDLTDYAFTDAGFFGAGDNWLLGDYDYSGVVDLTDYAFQDAGFFGQGAPLDPSFSGGPGKGGVVPEPSSVGLLLIAALGMASRRRR